MLQVLPSVHRCLHPLCARALSIVLCYVLCGALTGSCLVDRSYTALSGHAHSAPHALA